jgi:hypothetical protein
MPAQVRVAPPSRAGIRKPSQQRSIANSILG